MKRCVKCGVEKDDSCFYSYKKKDKKYLLSYCKDCFNARAREYNKTERGQAVKRKYRSENRERLLEGMARWNRENIEYVRNRRLLKSYGITTEQLDLMIESQSYKCKICGCRIEKSWRMHAVDHCHATGRVRGVLCHQCNHGLGSFRDNTSFLASAIEYLKDNSGCS